MNAKTDTGAGIGFDFAFGPVVLFAPETGGGSGGSDDGEGKTVLGAAAAMYPEDKTGAAGVDDADEQSDAGKDVAEKKAADDKGVADKADADKKAAADKADADKKAADDKKVDGEKKEEEGQKKAPEKYQFEAPNGFKLDEDAVKAFEPVARELDLDQDQAQKLVNLYATVRRDDQARHETIVADWAKEAANDPEMGGEKWQATLAAATAGVKAYASDSLVEYFELSGLGNHPELIRMFAKIGRSISDDKGDVPDASGVGKAAKGDDLSVLYPDDAPRRK